MKAFLLTLALVLFLAVGLTEAGTSGPAVTRHDLTLRLFPDEGRLQGVAALTVLPDGAAEVILTLAPQATVEEVRLAGTAAPFNLAAGRLAVAVTQELRRGEVTIVVRYAGTFRDPVPEAPLSAEDPTYGVATVISPAGTFLAGGAGWYPDLPGSRALFRVRVEAPAGTEAVAAGRLVERKVSDGRSVSVWETATPLDDLTLAAGPYEVQEARAGTIPLYAYFYPQTAGLAPSYLAAAAGYLELYQELFGPYPFEKFAVVENFFPTGYGFPSWTLLGSSVVRLPFIVETSLGHEIAHSWWGNGVRVDDARGNWSEGLTTYLADHLYQERSSPEAGREYRMKLLRDYATLVPPAKDFPLARFVGRRSAAGQAVGYGKGAMVFHMTRQRVGEAAFWTGLRRLARERMFREATWQDFAQALGESGGTDLAPFFRQWVERPGAPVLRLEQVAAEEDGDGWRVRGVVAQEGAVFDLEVPLRLETAAGTVRQSVASRAPRTPFTLRAPGRPQRLSADPGVDLFRRLDPAEIPPTVNGIRGSTSLLVVAADSLPAETLAAARLLLAALRQERALVRREAEVRPEELRGHDLLYLGTPARKGLLPSLPAGLGLEPAAFALEGRRYRSGEAALFAALPHPAEPQRTAAVFLPLSAAAAEAAARKVPHYGKYSYLVFEAGDNRAKGIWPAPASPLRHDFPP